MKYLIFILFISCNTAKKVIKPSSTIYTLNGFKSYSPKFRGYIKEFKWKIISGNSFIYFPDSIITKIRVSNESIIELKGIDNEGFKGYDTIKLQNKLK